MQQIVDRCAGTCVAGWRNPGRALRVALLATCLMLPAARFAAASPVEVVMAQFEKLHGERAQGGWRVSVTLRHGDTGWDHYANVWVVETLDGSELGRRVLFHPHEDEQPFTRSQRIAIPAHLTRVRVRAGDNLSGIDSNSVVVDLTRRDGERFQVR